MSKGSLPSGLARPKRTSNMAASLTPKLPTTACAAMPSSPTSACRETCRCGAAMPAVTTPSLACAGLISWSRAVPGNAAPAGSPA